MREQVRSTATEADSDLVTLQQFANPTRRGCRQDDVAQARSMIPRLPPHLPDLPRVDRPGPHPPIFFDLSKDGGMLRAELWGFKAADSRSAENPRRRMPPAPKMTGGTCQSWVARRPTMDPADRLRREGGSIWVTIEPAELLDSPPSRE